MKTEYRALLLAGCIIAVALPALAQPANLLAPLSGQSPGDEPPAGQPSPVIYPDNHPLLAAARVDVLNHRWNAAESELERSETFFLDGGVKSDSGVVTSPSPAMSHVIQARVAVKERAQVDALLAINKAMSTMVTPIVSSAGSGLPAGAALASFAQYSSAPPEESFETSPAPTLPPLPMVTKALLPGHWQLAGSQYHWVPADTSYRTVETNPFIPGHYEYRGGAWVWVVGHYGKATS